MSLLLAAAVDSTEFVGVRRMVFNLPVSLKETLHVQKPFRGANFRHCALHVSESYNGDAASHGATDNHANLGRCVV